MTFDLLSIHPSHRVMDRTQQHLPRHIHGNHQYFMDFGFGSDMKYAWAQSMPSEYKCKEMSTISDFLSIHHSH